MKKLLSIMLSVLLVAGAMIGFAQAEKAPLVGISTPDNPTGWVGAVQWMAKETAENLGLNYVLRAAANANDQANIIDEFIGMGCDYIVLFPLNDELEVAAQRIMDAGIVLVNFDRTLGDLEPDYYVAGNNREMGVIGAQYILDKLGSDGGKIAIMNIPLYGQIFQERIDGAMSVFENASNIEIIGEWASDDGSPESGLRAFTDVLQANPQIDAVYSTDDEMSNGILQAIKEQNRTDIKVITGGGGAQSYFNIMNDFPDIWVSSQTYAPYMMKDAVEVVNRLINGEEVESRIIIPPYCLDRTSYQQYLDDNGITPDAPY